MTDRFHSLTVVLEKDIREDDAEHLMSAIRMMRGVLTVTGEVSDPIVHLAQTRARREILEKISRLLYDEPGGEA